MKDDLPEARFVSNVINALFVVWLLALALLLATGCQMEVGARVMWPNDTELRPMK